ncbi:MAG TPA: hypothetical protein VGJ05_19860 [Fimbriiglobus sp.]|jgi:photosystem II stability/assembly factor-like uncharacterized protein
MSARIFGILALLSSAAVGRSADEPDPKKAPIQFHGMQYRLVGPYAGGRVCRACGVPGDPLTYYAASASGGVWKSTDGGLSWKPTFDDQPTSSIGSIAVAPSDPNVVYVGTGEANIRGNVVRGVGIFRSTDAGKSWQHVWKQVGQIGTMAVHPTNPNIAFAAVLGHAFGPNPERGVYRTTDGGETWQRVLFQNADTGCSDVEIDPNNPRVIFAGFWQTRRRPWDLTSGGPGSDLFVSHDGGDTWVSLRKDAKKNGLPAGIWGKIGVAIAPSNSSRVYAVIEAEKGGLFRSDDGGDSWVKTTDDRNIRQRAWYYSTLTVHPANPDVIYAPQVTMIRSADGGRTFKPVRGFHHGDHHDLWIDPKNPDRMIGANDGGVDISTDGGRTWFAPPLPVTQFYHVSADTRSPYHVMGCMQDLGSASGPSLSLSGAIALGDWHNVGGGEAGFAIPDPSDPNIVYAGEYGGILTRFDFRTRQTRNISVNQWDPSGIDPAKHKYRFQWTAPILISPHAPKTVYHGGNVLFRTTDGGQSWAAVSPDLTRNDKQKQQWSGGPITGDNTGAETYCTIFALAESPKQKGLLWAGSDDGLVHVSTDDAKTWTNVTANVPDLPDWGTVVCIEPSPFDAHTAYLVVDNHRMDDVRPYLWKTTDTGKTWTKLSADLPADIYLHAVREDPKKKGLLYLGTDTGVMFSPDDGATWKPFQLNLPTVPVHDLKVKDDDLVVATHGRALWILDDLTVVRDWTDAVKSEPAHLFPIRPTVEWSIGGGNLGQNKTTTCQNPDYGAVAWFYLAKSPKKGDVRVEVRNAAGRLVSKWAGVRKDVPKPEEDEDEITNDRKFKVQRGLNKFVWDVTYDGAEVIKGAKADAGNPGRSIPARPGKYAVKLFLGTNSFTQTVVVKLDPRLDPKIISSEQETLALTVRDDISNLSRTVARIRAVQRQIALRKDLLKDRDDAKALLTDSETLGKKFEELEEKLHNPKAKIVYDIFAARGGAMLYSQYAFLLGGLSDGDGPPTKAMKDLAADLSKQLSGLLAEFDKLADETKTLNAAAKALGVPELYIPPVKKSKDQ